MTKRPNFFSPTGIVVAVALVVVVVALTLLLGPVLFSPGSLNSQAKAATLGGVASHAQLGNHCGACHTAPWSSQTMADKCLACHTDVGSQISGKTGLHGTLAAMRSAPCGGCHPDHGGPNGPLTSLNESSFPHDVTGFTLSGHREKNKGGRFSCADCHPKGFGGTFDQAICANCHAAMDPSFMKQHEAAFGTDCTPCHDGGSNAKVDHSKFPFKLTGKHAGLPCNDCHAGAKSIQDFQKAPQDCNSCHAKDDKHKGSFGSQCGSCHNTSGWGGASFNHDIFPVNHGTDKQASTCQTCHPSGTSTYTCFGCHQHTQSNVVGQHEGQSLTALTDCIKCHAGGKVPD